MKPSCIIQPLFSELVLATHNQGKLHEITVLLKETPIAVQSAGELGLPEPEETGTTFAANAALKAHAAAQASGRWSLADDSGLAVEALNGAPGIYSARWAGESKDFAFAMKRVQEELVKSGHPAPWKADFVCVLCLAAPDNREFIFEGRIEGTLQFPAQGDKGFGYDPIFIPVGDTRTFAQISADEKNSISHRARAFKQFLEFLKTTHS